MIIDMINNKASSSDWCKIESDGVPIGSGTLAGDLRGINPWSNCNWWDIEGRFGYSDQPNNHAANLINFGGKNTYRTLLGLTRLLISEIFPSKPDFT